MALQHSSRLASPLTPYNDNYSHKSLFHDFDDILGELNLVQMVGFSTWSRIINNELKESTLDHIYCKSPMCISNISNIVPYFGDHRLIIFCICASKILIEPNLHRDWRKYSKDSLCCLLSDVEWSIDIDDVQGFWNDFETKIIKVVDELVQLCAFVNNVVKEKVPRLIKNKINLFA